MVNLLAPFLPLPGLIPVPQSWHPQLSIQASGMQYNENLDYISGVSLVTSSRA
jgi:hypothetical protein